MYWSENPRKNLKPKGKTTIYPKVPPTRNMMVEAMTKGIT